MSREESSYDASGHQSSECNIKSNTNTKISTSTPQKKNSDQTINQSGCSDNIGGISVPTADDEQISADSPALVSQILSSTFNDATTTSISSTSNSNSFTKSPSSSSPIAKRHLNSSSISSVRPQSSYSARVLIFEDSDQEVALATAAGTGTGGTNTVGTSSLKQLCTSTSSTVEGGTTKSSTGLDILASSPKNDTSMSSNHSLMRNLNLTKSSSGGLSGSSISLPGRNYTAFLRKISYQHNYSMRSSSNGNFYYRNCIYLYLTNC